MCTPQAAIFLQGPPQTGIESAQDSLKLPPQRVISDIFPQGQLSTSSGLSRHCLQGLLPRIYEPTTSMNLAYPA